MALQLETHHAESVREQRGEKRVVCCLTRKQGLTWRKQNISDMSFWWDLTEKLWRFLQTFEANNGSYEHATTAAFNLQCGGGQDLKWHAVLVIRSCWLQNAVNHSFAVILMENRGNSESSGLQEWKWKQVEISGGFVWMKLHKALSLKNCVTVLPCCVSSTYIPEINFHISKFHSCKVISDVIGVNILSVWY
jgi:hypothetical protein